MKMTAPRERGFRVLVAEQAEGRLARESNATSEAAGYVYWQTVRWLITSELAYFPSGSTHLALTDKGRELAKEMGL